ncbi:MAG: ribonuclease R [Xanthomonadales bacterium]|nr:ribonuclease R [Xanthomonadales bacterium]
MNKKSKKNKSSSVGDLYAEREANRYDHPIPSREAILALLNERQELMKFDRLAQELGISGDRDRNALEKRLAAMVRAGQLIKNRRGGFGIARKLDLEPGRVIGHPDGFGFVALDAGGDDYFLNPKQMRRVLHGDRVLVSLTKVDARGRKEGQIVEILERANSHVVGRFHEESGISFVVADERRFHQEVLIPKENIGAATVGDYVYVEITEQPEFRRQPVGRVLEVLGRSVTAPMAVEIALRSFDIPSDWPKAALNDAKRIPDHVDEQDHSGRKDLRDVPLVTIDGADAKDFDDAVYAKRNDDGGWKLLVAIADVSHYVRPGTALDDEAQRRGTSAYFPNRVVPMLPENLSNGICSLNPRVDRLCMVCEIQFKPDGRAARSRFYPAVMHSHARLTYEQAWDLINGRGTDDQSKPILESLQALYSLFGALRNRREQRGAIDFDSQEVGFRFDDEGEVEAIVPRKRNDAHKLIEECMIAANVEAAKTLERNKIPAPFRVHAQPKATKLDDLRETLAPLGLTVPISDKVKPSHFARILKTVAGRPEQGLVEALVLRTQQMAVYQVENKGHFGLALDAYTHFTSPIRRYPDLLVHRALMRTVGGGSKGPGAGDSDEVTRLCSHCSMAERRAEEAARDVDARLKCAYAERHVGDELDGTISGVTSFGVFVDLDGLATSGLVHVTMLPNDYYHFDPTAHTLTGERQRRTYRLGDRVRVNILRVDPDERQIDLKIAASDD